MNLNRIKLTMATGMLAASMILPGMTAFAAVDTDKVIGESNNNIITKTLETPEGVSYTNLAFKFTFEQEDLDSSGKPTLNHTDSGVIVNQVKADIKGTATDSTNELTIGGFNSSGDSYKRAVDADEKELDYYTNSIQGSIDLSNLTSPGVYTYKVKEYTTDLKSEKGVVWKASGDEYRLRVYVKTVTKDGKTSLERTMTIVNVTSDGASTDANTRDGAKKKSAEFVNKMTRRGGSGTDGDKSDTPTVEDGASFSITKTTDNDTYTNDDTEYTFTVSFEENSLNKEANGLNKTNTYSYKVYDASGNVVENNGKEVSGTLSEDDGWTLKLKKGQTAKFLNIYAGTRVTVQESYVTNLYEVTAKSKSDGATTEVEEKFGGNGSTALSSDSVIKADGVADSSKKGNGILIGEGENYVKFTNTFSNVTVTGVVTNIAPYVTLVVAAVIAVAAYMGLKSRIAR